MTTPTAPRRRTPRATLVLTVALAAGLGGCVGIPTSGPIHSGQVPVSEPGSAFPLPAADPVVDADPAAIVTGFLSAGQAGLSDDFVVARKFLTVNASAEWDPRTRVLVYPSQSAGPVVGLREDGTWLVTVPIEARVDAAGIYTEAAPGSHDELVFELLRDGAGQWRISSLDDGVVMSWPNFDNQYRETPVYFATPDRTQLVPDVRWFPTAKAATSAVTELLAGPAPWLRDAVVTGAPDGARLSTASVPVSSTHVASVDLSAEANLADGDRNLLQAQLEATLERLPFTLIDEVRVTVGTAPWEPTAPPLDLARDVGPAHGPYLLTEGRLALVDGGAVEPVPGAAPLTDLVANHPAISPDESIRVVMDGISRLMLLPPDAGEPVELFGGTDLIAPTIDRLNWVWTGEVTSVGTLDAVTETGEAIEVKADWLEGRTVRSMRVSRDGSRIVIVTAGPGEPRVWVDVAAVFRDERGRPQRIGDPVRIGASLTDATEVSWVTESSVAVLGLSDGLGDPTMHLVPLGGPTQAQPLMDGTVSIATGKGNRALYLADDEGTLRSQQGGSWVVIAEDVRDPVFPG